MVAFILALLHLHVVLEFGFGQPLDVAVGKAAIPTVAGMRPLFLVGDNGVRTLGVLEPLDDHGAAELLRTREICLLEQDAEGFRVAVLVVPGIPDHRKADPAGVVPADGFGKYRLSERCTAPPRPNDRTGKKQQNHDHMGDPKPHTTNEGADDEDKRDPERDGDDQPACQDVHEFLEGVPRSPYLIFLPGDGLLPPQLCLLNPHVLLEFGLGKPLRATVVEEAIAAVAPVIAHLVVDDDDVLTSGVLKSLHHHVTAERFDTVELGEVGALEIGREITDGPVPAGKTNEELLGREIAFLQEHAERRRIFLIVVTRILNH